MDDPDDEARIAGHCATAAEILACLFVAQNAFCVRRVRCKGGIYMNFMVAHIKKGKSRQRSRLKDQMRRYFSRGDSCACLIGSYENEGSDVSFRREIETIVAANATIVGRNLIAPRRAEYVAIARFTNGLDRVELIHMGTGGLNSCISVVVWQPNEHAGLTVKALKAADALAHTGSVVRTKTGTCADDTFLLPDG